jgi:7,8-dihydro-6-hydroxymethylpterin-pyrophosphokinase
LDLLYAGNLLLDSPAIRLRQRRFALTPLAETSPDLALSRLLAVGRLLAELDVPDQVTRLGVPLFDRE